MDVPELDTITRWQQIEKLRSDGKLTPAEIRLIEEVRSGKPVKYAAKPPTRLTPEVHIRADIVRYLLLGGCENFKTLNNGVRIHGAWISGELILNFCRARGAIDLTGCRIAERIQALQLSAKAVFLDRAKLTKGVNCEGIECEGGVFLREAEVAGELSFLNARLDGQLSCKGALINNSTGDALFAQGLHCKGGVSLQNVSAQGEVNLFGAFIGIQLNLSEAKLINASGKALNAQGLRVGGSFYWRDIRQVSGDVDLTDAQTESFMYDCESFRRVSSLNLRGFVYNRFSGPIDLTQWRDWLYRGAVWNQEFFPQPYEQFAASLREHGHSDQAREIMIEMERLKRRFSRELAYRRGKKAAMSSTLGNFWRDNRLWWVRNWDLVFGVVVGYGYKPTRAILALIALVGIATALALGTWRAGDFAPNSGVILISQEWQAYAKNSDNPAADWSRHSTAGSDYETFNALAYGIDVVIPVVSFGQEAAWAPSTSRSWWGWNMLWIEWVLTMSGWFVSVVGAAAVTGAVRQD